MDLERYKSELTRQLEGVRQGLALNHERYSRDYALFATRRNEVYAETYGLLERARGAYGAHFARLLITRDFRESDAADIRRLAKNLKYIIDSEREQLTGLLDTPGQLRDAGELATRLYERNGLRAAQRAFRFFGNAAVLHSLYFSSAVEQALETTRHTLAALSTFADERIEDREPREYRKSSEAMEDLDRHANNLRRLMQREMREGFHVETLQNSAASPESASTIAPLD
jgi:hypothetical protein